MSVRVAITDGPVAPPAPRDWPGAGAVLVFEGVVRADEAGSTIAGLDYQAYQPMAGERLADLAGQIIQRFGVLGVAVEHSQGFVPAGAVSFRLTIASEHRNEGLAAAGWFIDSMKRDVPIWKSIRPPE